MGSQIGGLIGGIWGDPGKNFIDLAGGGKAVFGSKPQVADYTPTDLTAETGKAVAGNLANYSSITDLLNQIIPGFSDILTQGTANTQQLLSGQLPDDVAAQVQRNSAQQATQGGYGGTPMGHALTARDLGRTSLDLMQAGQNSAQLWSNLAESAYSPFTVSTGQQAQTTAANNAGAQATQQFKYNVAAAPDPAALGQFNVDAALGQQMLSFGMAAAGGGFGGGGGSGGSAQASPYNVSGNALNSMQQGYQYDPNTGQYGHSMGGGYAAPQGAWGYSDRRLKTEVLCIGTNVQNFNVYEFTYIWEEGPAAVRHIGVMADEVRLSMPEAVREVNGYLQVDYSQVLI